MIKKWLSFRNIFFLISAIVICWIVILVSFVGAVKTNLRDAEGYFKYSWTLLQQGEQQHSLDWAIKGEELLQNASSTTNSVFWKMNQNLPFIGSNLLSTSGVIDSADKVITEIAIPRLTSFAENDVSPDQISVFLQGSTGKNQSLEKDIRLLEDEISNLTKLETLNSVSVIKNSIHSLYDVYTEMSSYFIAITNSSDS